MCPSTVTASLLWLLLLSPGLLLAQDSGFTHCSHSFYRQSPPQGSYGELLRPLCHPRPGGRSFATLYQPTCGSPVYSAFHLSSGLTESATEEAAEPEIKDEEGVTVVVPSLLRGDGEEPELSNAAPHLQQWDSAVTALVQSNIAPQCQSAGGDLYVLIGAGRLEAVGEAECEAKLLWSAVCCAAPDGKDSSSVAFIKDAEGEQRQVTVKELEELLGVTELFSEGCGAQITENTAEIDDVSESEAQTLSEAASETAPAEDAEAEEVKTASPDTESPVTSEQAEGTVESQIVPEEDATVAESAKTAQVSPDSEESEVEASESARSEALVSSETVEEEQEVDNSTSTLFYVLSTTLSILKAPLRPVVSTITELPGQVSHVLQEDLNVLAAIPGETCSVFYLLISDIFSWIGSAFRLVYNIFETIFSSVYYLISSLVGALFDNLYAAVTGIGTLIGNIFGIFGDMLDTSWWATKFFGGKIVEQGEDYVETVVGELGTQTSAAGSGLGNLAGKSGNVVGYGFKVVWRVISGVFNIAFGIVGDAFEGERSQETFDIAAAVLPEKTEA